MLFGLSAAQTDVVTPWVDASALSGSESEETEKTVSCIGEVCTSEDFSAEDREELCPAATRSASVAWVLSRSLGVLQVSDVAFVAFFQAAETFVVSTLAYNPLYPGHLECTCYSLVRLPGQTQRRCQEPCQHHDHTATCKGLD